MIVMFIVQNILQAGEDVTLPGEGSCLYRSAFLMNFSLDLSRDRLDWKRGVLCCMFASVPEDFVHKKYMEENITLWPKCLAQAVVSGIGNESDLMWESLSPIALLNRDFPWCRQKLSAKAITKSIFSWKQCLPQSNIWVQNTKRNIFVFLFTKTAFPGSLYLDF